MAGRWRPPEQWSTVVTPLSYIKLAGALILAGLLAYGVWYVGDLRTQIADAQATIATQAATVNEANAVHQADTQAIARLEAARAIDAKVLADERDHENEIQNSLAQAKEAISHAKPDPRSCAAADDRDRTVVGWMRGGLSAVAPAAGGNQSASDHAAR